MSSITDVTLTTGWDITQQELRSKLLGLEAACKEQEQVDIPVKEYFIDGCYGREVFIPKGTCLVGEIHHDEWITVVSRGHIRIVSEEGTSIVDAREQPVTFISPAGVKRAGYALEDTWWTMFIATPHKTSEEIRKHHIASDYKELENKKCLGLQQP